MSEPAGCPGQGNLDYLLAQYPASDDGGRALPRATPTGLPAPGPHRRPTREPPPTGRLEARLTANSRGESRGEPRRACHRAPRTRRTGASSPGPVDLASRCAAPPSHDSLVASRSPSQWLTASPNRAGHSRTRQEAADPATRSGSPASRRGQAGPLSGCATPLQTPSWTCSLPSTCGRTDPTNRLRVRVLRTRAIILCSKRVLNYAVKVPNSPPRGMALQGTPRAGGSVWGVGYVLVSTIFSTCQNE